MLAHTMTEKILAHASHQPSVRPGQIVDGYVDLLYMHEMLALAQRNIAQAGATNVELLRGHIEDIPLPANSIDVVISNCVVNLAADKPAVFREIARVLRPGGRIGITDIVAEDHLTAEERADRGSYTGRIAGALSFSEAEAGLRAAGLTDISVTATHSVADGMHSAIIKATRPVDAPPVH